MMWLIDDKYYKYFLFINLQGEAGGVLGEEEYVLDTKENHGMLIQQVNFS